jgi:hypothetical protein
MFGAECRWRQALLLGTDLSRMIGVYSTGYEQATAHFKALPFLSDEDKKWILGRGLCEASGMHEPLRDAGRPNGPGYRKGSSGLRCC